MKKTVLPQIIMFSGFLLVSGYVQSEIYKCKNSDGVVNFTSVPCGEKASGIKRPEKKKIELNEDGTKKSKQQIINERLKKEKEFLEATKRQQIDEKQKREKLEQHNKKIELNCKRAKQDLMRYQRSQYLYNKDENGKKVVLSDAQRKKAELDAQRRITYWCRN